MAVAGSAGVCLLTKTLAASPVINEPTLTMPSVSTCSYVFTRPRRGGQFRRLTESYQRAIRELSEGYQRVIGGLLRLLELPS